MINTVLVEEAKQEDAEGILEVQTTTWLCVYPSEKHNISKEDIQEKIDTFKLDRWKKNIQSKEKRNANIWVAKMKNKIIGFSGALKGKGSHQLSAIYVLPEHHRKGIGNKLITKVFEFLGKDKPITVEVVSYNVGAINFYRKHGFSGEREFTSEHAALPSGKVMPEVEMTWLPK